MEDGEGGPEPGPAERSPAPEGWLPSTRTNGAWLPTAAKGEPGQLQLMRASLDAWRGLGVVVVVT